MLIAVFKINSAPCDPSSFLCCYLGNLFKKPVRKKEYKEERKEACEEVVPKKRIDDLLEAACAEEKSPVIAENLKAPVVNTPDEKQSDKAIKEKVSPEIFLEKNIKKNNLAEKSEEVIEIVFFNPFL